MDILSLENLASWEWPEDADEIILNTLKDREKSVEERLAAVQLAGDYVVIDDEIGKALLSVIEDKTESEDMRGFAAISLGGSLEHADFMGFEDPDDILLSQEMVEKVRSVFKCYYHDEATPKSVRRSILESAVRYPEKWHQDAVRAAYDQNDREWRLTAVFCMRFVEGFKQEVLESLDSDDSDIHYQAVRALCNHDIEEAWPHLVKLLTRENTEKNLLLAAIDAAASMKPLYAAELFGHLADHEDEDIVAAMYEAIAMNTDLADEDFDPDDV